MNDFLPPNYELPASGGRYMKLQKGENRFRVLGSAIIGYEYWKEHEGKRSPVRVRMGQKVSTDDLESSDGNPLKHFWAFPVWDYSDNSVKVLEITQKGIQKELTALVQDEDWGGPTAYDVTVRKDGEGMETTYSTNPKPKKELTGEQKAAWKETLDAGFNLNALFDGGDPFTAGIDIEEVIPPAASREQEEYDYVTGEKKGA